jgi:hypothetical protein
MWLVLLLATMAATLDHSFYLAALLALSSVFYALTAK